jgi:hypothetical protein
MFVTPRFALVSLSLLTAGCSVDDRTVFYDGSDAGLPSGSGGGSVDSSVEASSGGTVSPDSGEAGPRPTVTTTSLPAFWFNITASGALTASGGSGSGYTYAVTSGGLPPGLTLDADGTLHGTPSSAGTFKFTVKVLDGSGAAGEQEVSLTVERKRYLAYTSDEEAYGQRVVYVVDISKATLPKTKLDTRSASDAGTTSIGRLAFSPDGRWLAYTVSSPDEWLWVADVSGATVAQPVRVDVPGPFDAIAWSPDSKRLGIMAFSTVDAAESAYYTDLSSGAPSKPFKVGPADQYNAVGWASDTTIVYSAANVSVAYATVGPTGPTLPQTVTPGQAADGILAGTGHEVLLSLYAGNHPMCRLQNEYLDLTAGTSARGFFSSDLGWAVGKDAANELALSTIADKIADLTTLALTGGDTCGGGFWARRSPMVAWRKGTSMQLTVVGAPSTTQTVAGALPAIVPPFNNDDLRFSPDDSWMAFAFNTSSQPILVSSIKKGVPGPWQDASGTPNGGTDVYLVDFSPSSQALAFRGMLGDAMSQFELYVADLTKLGVSPRKLSAALPYPDASVSTARWSTDGSQIAYIQNDGSSGSGARLFVADVLDPLTAVREVTGPMNSNATSTAAVGLMAFQP